MINMEISAKRKRSSIKKTLNTKTKSSEIPPNIAAHTNVEHFLRHPLGQKWIKYEWMYDEVEDIFFKKSNTFEGILSSKFARLKTRHLTAAEWRKIHKLTNGRKIRRFSAKFVQEQRIELEKFRQTFNVLRENQRIHQLVKLASMSKIVSSFKHLELNQSKFEIYALIVETKRLLTRKQNIVAELRGINNAKAGAQDRSDEEPNGNVDAAIASLRSCNEEIVDKWNKLMAFQVVKDALFFDALDKKKILKPLSPFYFRRKCEIQIHENHHEFNSKAFITSHAVMMVLNILLELTLVIIKHEQLTVNAGDLLNSLIMEHLDLMLRSVATENIEYFQTNCLPLISSILKKVYV